MLIRILALVFLFSACSGANTSEKKEEQVAEKKEMTFIFKTQDDAAQHVGKILAETSYPLTDEQRSTINDLAASYTVESLNEGRATRSELRKKVNAILSPEQVGAWKAYNRKRRKSVTIE